MGQSAADLGLRTDGIRGKNGIYWGWAPDSDPYVNINDIDGITGKKSCTVGLYSQMTSKDTYHGEQMTDHLEDVVASGAILIASIMPDHYNGGPAFNEITEDLANQIVGVIRQFTDRGVKVWLRWGHEMNWYVQPGSGPHGSARYSGTPEEFVNAWYTIHAAFSDAQLPGVKFFWSPNAYDDISDLGPWYPDGNPNNSATVDIVGMDKYADNDSFTFSNTFDLFYKVYAGWGDRAMCLGETGARGNDIAVKEAWLRQLATVDLSMYPNLKSITWFEYNKPEEGNTDYRIITDQTPEIVAETLSSFA